MSLWFPLESSQVSHFHLSEVEPNSNCFFFCFVFSPNNQWDCFFLPFSGVASCGEGSGAGAAETSLFSSFADSPFGGLWKPQQIIGTSTMLNHVLVFYFSLGMIGTNYSVRCINSPELVRTYSAQKQILLRCLRCLWHFLNWGGRKKKSRI